MDGIGKKRFVRLKGAPMRFLSSRLLKKAIQPLGLGVGLLLVSLSSFAQGNAGRIVGAITDQSGGAIAGATVTVTDVQRGVSRALTTDDSGSFNAPNLTPGTYKVRGEFKGFKATERDNILLETGGEVRVDFTLQPGEQTQTITVTEALPMVETTNAELGGTLQSDIVDNLPLNGRNFSNLIQLRPGFTIYPGGSGWTQSTNGLRNTDNVYMVDGINGDDPWMSQAVWDSVMASGDSGTLISIDSIDEFKTEENPRAEYGWKPGGIVNVGIKSGTNAYHGTAYAYGRDGAWDARNYFNPAPQPIPSLSLEQFGATFGGPVKKDKLFYFVTFEEQRYALGSTQVITDPVTATGIAGENAKNSLIAACQAALAVGAVGSGTPGALTALSAQLAGLSNTCVPKANYPGLFPVVSGTNPVGVTGALAINSIGNGLLNNNRIDSGLGKVDYHLSDKHSLNAMYYISPGTGQLNDSPSQTNPLWETNQYARSMAFAGAWTFTPSSSVVNEARVGYSHYYQVFLSEDAAQNPANYSFNGSNYSINTGQTNPFYFGFPGISISGLSGALGAGWPKIVGPDGVLQITDHISYLRGKHAFKFGGEILDNLSQTNVTANAKGPLIFSSLQDFFAGMPNGVPPPGTIQGGVSSDGNGAATILTGNLLRNFSFQGYALFIQDDWRVKPRLTVNLGLRYEINTVPTERNDLAGNFNPNAPTGIQQLGNGLTSLYNGDHNNFAPRLGLAWDVFGTGRTVVRAGGGIYFEQIALDVFNGIGNSNGLRAEPTGASLIYCSISTTGTCPAANTVVQPGSGTIGVINTAFGGGNGTPILNGTGCAAANGECPGEIPFNWANNGSSNPIYSFQAFCGDGKTAIPSGPLKGFTPAQCSIYGVEPNLRTPYAAEYSLGIQHAITHALSLDIGYVGNKGTKFVSNLEINQPNCTTAAAASLVPGSAAFPCASGVMGPGWTPAIVTACLSKASNCKPSTANEQLARPFNAQFPYFKTINEFGNFDNSNYNSLQATLTARNYHGLTLTAGYTYSHALGVSSGQGTGGGSCTPVNSYASLDSQCYGPTEFDIRNRETFSATYNIPGKAGLGQILQGWSVNAVAIVQSGLPWGISDTTTDFAGTGDTGHQWNFYGNPNDFTAIKNYQAVPLSANGSPGIPYYSGTSNAACLAQSQAMGALAVASLTNLGCYALGNSILIPPAYGSYGTTARGQWRDNGFYNVDFSVTKSFKFKERLTAQFRAEFFNVLNHPDFVNPAGGPGGGGASLNPSRAGTTSGLAYVSNTPDVASSNPVLGSGGARAIQLGLKLIF
jgi:hypothetical protein